MLDLQIAEALACEVGMSEFAPLREARVQLIARGLPGDVVVQFREAWTGSVKPLSGTWAPTVGMYGGVATIVEIAGALRHDLNQVRAALNTRGLLAAKRGARGRDQFDVAVGVYQSWLQQPVHEVARTHMILRQEVGLYARRLSRCIAELGFLSIDDALAHGRDRLKAHFHLHYALHHKLYDRVWTPSPPEMWKLPTPSWWTP